MGERASATCFLASFPKKNVADRRDRLRDWLPSSGLGLEGQPDTQSTSEILAGFPGVSLAGQLLRAHQVLGTLDGCGAEQG